MTKFDFKAKQTQRPKPSTTNSSNVRCILCRKNRDAPSPPFREMWLHFCLWHGVLVLTIPEADGVPVSVEGLEILLIVDSLFASRTDGQTSTSCNNSNTQSPRMN